MLPSRPKVWMSERRKALHEVLGRERLLRAPVVEVGSAFAPANIALVKYWGKRDVERNLPLTSSLSISLGDRGAHTRIAPSASDVLVLNQRTLPPEAPEAQRLFAFLDHFRPSPDFGFAVDSTSTIPIGAGLASSASGFAAVVLALNELFAWQLEPARLSVLARIGSGSASRSIHRGFVVWQRGTREDGSDSFAEPIASAWTDLQVGLLCLSQARKPIGSTAAMNRTVAESTLFGAWPQKVAQDMETMRHAIAEQDFDLLGSTAESNALSMHATMFGATPPICYFLPESIQALHRIWQLRGDGLRLYATMDAGPNVKLLLQRQDVSDVQSAWPEVEVIDPFS